MKSLLLVNALLMLSEVIGIAKFLAAVQADLPDMPVLGIDVVLQDGPSSVCFGAARPLATESFDYRQRHFPVEGGLRQSWNPFVSSR